MIEACTVKRDMEIIGKDFWGRDASLTFASAERSGWWWKIGEHVDGDDVLIPITREMIKVRSRRVCFEHDSGVLLNVVEHITVLRLCGLDRIVLSSRTKWLPYLTPMELWNALETTPLHYELSWTKLNGQGSGDLKGRISHVTESLCENRIFVDAEIDYPQIGKKHDARTFETRQDVVQLFGKGSQSQGWPRWHYFLGYVVRTFFRWPHFERVAWAQNLHDPACLKDRFLQHRIVDILGMIGAMSLRGSSVISCDFLSRKGGHKTDLLAFQEALDL